MWVNTINIQNSFRDIFGESEILNSDEGLIKVVQNSFQQLDFDKSLEPLFIGGGVVVSALVSRSSGPGSSPGRGPLCCVLGQDT